MTLVRPCCIPAKKFMAGAGERAIAAAAGRAAGTVKPVASATKSVRAIGTAKGQKGLTETTVAAMRRAPLLARPGTSCFVIFLFLVQERNPPDHLAPWRCPFEAWGTRDLEQHPGHARGLAATRSVRRALRLPVAPYDVPIGAQLRRGWTHSRLMECDGWRERVLLSCSRPTRANAPDK